MASVTIDQILACPHLPSLPTVAVEVLALTSKPNVNLAEIARVVQNDQALCAKILKTVNSSFYGLSTPCPTITRALSYLGLSTVKSLVLGFSLVDCTRSSGHGFDLIDYWRRCIYSATATRCIALVGGACDPEEAFIAALMQDIGMPAIHNAIGAAYQHIIDETQGDHDLLLAAEHKALGFHHAEVGARMTKRWRLPAELVTAIRHHHHPESATSHIRLVRAVALGSMAAATLAATSTDAAMARFQKLAEEWFGIDRPHALTLLAQIAEEARELSRLFQINTGAPPDINAILAQAEEASLQHQLSVQREAQELRESNSTLTRMTLADALTGVGNRRRFDSELPRLFEEARAANKCLAVIMVDADNFKSLNDTHGHQAGDVILVQLARRMQEQVQTHGVVCRYGGEEFAVILTGADRRTAARLAESIRIAIAATPFDIREAQGHDESLQTTVSLGVAAFEPAVSQRIISPQLLVLAADKALYAAKKSGRNCVRVFSLKPASGSALQNAAC